MYSVNMHHIMYTHCMVCAECLHIYILHSVHRMLLHYLYTYCIMCTGCSSTTYCIPIVYIGTGCTILYVYLVWCVQDAETLGNTFES